MLTIVAADIFGKTEALEALLQRLPVSTQIVDPYNGKAQHFENEAAAYAAFDQQVGLPAYVNQLRQSMQALEEPVQLLGFSVGASACWCLACNGNSQSPTQLVCFYGSQIRHHSDLNPTNKTTLVFPREEPNFDAQSLAAVLEPKPLVSVLRTPYLHGFMNKLSVNFDPVGYDTYIAWLNDQLTAS